MISFDLLPKSMKTMTKDMRFFPSSYDKAAYFQRSVLLFFSKKSNSLMIPNILFKAR